ncbi:amino acid synthesis family protein [Arthrobacter crystallopoietes]|uniref:amino acid synthesis family protein n=1 Tax=Crystallibacter crystallopoietes TaxID=37928 RepID=UPI001ABDC16F|nr:amino acid synthesis family protein [Arthrobacter crystallopoietes]QTG82592.1 amino acid synthesis family protein [Arthrobacter crystallopoietes]
MTLYEVRKRSLSIETVFHEGGPAPEIPVRMGAACAVVSNPYAGRYEKDLLPFMTELRALGTELATELADAMGGPERIEAYGKGAIVGVGGETEHGAVWHEAGGWAMRQVLGDPPAMVPSAKAVASAGYRLMVPMHYIRAAYVRSHYTAMEIGLQDSPRPAEILFAVVMADGGRIHSRLGGLTTDAVSVHDGQR